MTPQGSFLRIHVFNIMQTYIQHYDLLLQQLSKNNTTTQPLKPSLSLKYSENWVCKDPSVVISMVCFLLDALILRSFQFASESHQHVHCCD